MLKTKVDGPLRGPPAGVAVCLSAAMLWQVREQALAASCKIPKKLWKNYFSNF